MEKLCHHRDIYSHISKELYEIDLVDIFKKEIKNKQFDFEQYMKFPNFYNIFSIYVDRLLNIFSKTDMSRDQLLTSYYELKKIFNMRQVNETDGLSFNDILIFFEKFIKNENIIVYLESFQTIEEDRKYLFDKSDEAINKSNVIMNELYKLFESTGLIHFLNRDIDYSRYPFLNTIAFEKNDYLIDDDNYFKLNDLEPFFNIDDSLIQNKRQRYYFEKY